MFTFYRGNRIEELAEHFSRYLADQPNPPMQPEVVVVQNHGMSRWLSLFIAREQGVSGNFEFNFPAEQFWSLLRSMDDTIPEKLSSDRGPMTWSLLKIFDTISKDSRFNIFSEYIDGETKEQRFYRKWKLCDRIADVFDQYLVYRPDMLLKWEEGEYLTSDLSEQWQALMWNTLTTMWKNNSKGESSLHRAALQYRLLQAIDKAKLDVKDLPRRINVFGVSTMPPVFVRVLVKLSALIDVNYYWLSPARFEEHQQHSMVASLGAQGEEFLELLRNILDKNPETRKSYREVELFNSPKNDTVLNILQKDLLSPEDDTSAAIFDDSEYTESIRVHSCHSPVREVEVLYDQVLEMLDKNDDLVPNDILIMTPDIETYAPIIDSVFGAPEPALPALPYSIADRSIRSGYTGVNTFEQVLDLLESRFKVTDIIDILDFEAVRASFSFGENDVARIEHWVEKNRIRWGIDQSFKHQIGIPGDDSFTWKAGLNRLLLGYSVRDEEHLFKNIFPFDDIEGMEDAELLGRFSSFMESLFRFKERSGRLLPITDWCDLLHDILTTFIPDHRVYLEDISLVRAKIEDLRDNALVSDYKDGIPFRIVRSWMKKQLESRSAGGGYLGHGITFCALVPMRSIPFKVIGMIGMNDDAFPRTRVIPEFDLMAAYPRKGDRSRKKDDRYLFLESLVSTRKLFYISHVGQSSRDDTEYPPSVIVRELLNYLEDNYGIEKDHVNYDHRLQAFSKAYFDENGKLFTYSGARKEIAETLYNGDKKQSSFLDEPLKKADDTWKSISLNDLVKFYQHTSKYLLQNRLGIYLDEIKILDEDREPFDLEGLESYRLGQVLLERTLNNKSIKDYLPIAAARDWLPEGWTGRIRFEEKVREVQVFIGHIDNYIQQQKMEPVEEEISIGEFMLFGRLQDIYTNNRILIQYRSMRAADLVQLWISHLFLQMVRPNGYPKHSLLITKNDKDPINLCKLDPVHNPREILQDLLNIYWEGVHQKVRFFPESSFTYAKRILEDGYARERALNSASYKWQNPFLPYDQEGDDSYIRLLYKTENPLQHNDFHQLSLTFWKPFLKALSGEVRL